MKWTGREPDPADIRTHSTSAERAWNSVCSAVIAVGVIAAVGWLGWASPATAFAVATFAFWIFALCLVEDLRSRLPQLLEWSLIAPTAVVALFGLWALAQGWVVVIALGMVACHPLLISWARRDPAGRPRRASGNAGTRSASIPVSFHRPARLSEDGLRRTWGASFDLLQRTQSPDETARIVEYRHACLDEIERRYPERFAQWLEAGAPDVDEPARQLPSTFTVESSS
jgi:hypothetical protein